MCKRLQLYKQQQILKQAGDALAAPKQALAAARAYMDDATATRDAAQEELNAAAAALNAEPEVSCALHGESVPRCNIACVAHCASWISLACRCRVCLRTRSG